MAYVRRHHHLPKFRRRSLRGLTMPELLTALGACTVLLSVTATTVGMKRGGVDAAHKLAELGQAHACYAADWADRQWTALPYDAGGTRYNCAVYTSQVACPNQQILGDDGSPIWGFYLGSGKCTSFPGNCGNWNVYVPIDLASDTAAARGAFRVYNTWGFRQYLAKNFYAPEFYGVDDPNYVGVSARFGSASEFTYPIANVTGGYADSTYCLSPATMFSPDVMRARADGGFQAPSTFDHSVQAPTNAQCAHPSLKSRMCEWEWLRNAPQAGLSFSSGRDAAPYTLFFDGSVQSVRMADAEIDDLIVRDGSKSGDGLWSSDTPLGELGYRPTGTVDGLATGFHILTTGGILGRDILSRENGDRNGGGK